MTITTDRYEDTEGDVAQVLTVHNGYVVYAWLKINEADGFEDWPPRVVPEDYFDRHFCKVEPTFDTYENDRFNAAA